MESELLMLLIKIGFFFTGSFNFFLPFILSKTNLICKTGSIISKYLPFCHLPFTFYFKYNMDSSGL